MAGKGDIVKGALDFTAKLLSEGGEEAAKTGIRAYHGSPHDFDKFSMDKIGTGEGAQAYGHGLYFADREGIARSYRDKLSPKNYLLNAPESEIAQKYGQDVLDMFSSNGGDRNEIRDTINRLNEQNKRDLYDLGVSDVSQVKPQNDWGVEANLVNRTNRLNRLQDLLASPDVKIDPGHMYEVNIAADPNTFLDWDKPLSEQPEAIQRLFPSLEEAREIDAYVDKLSAEAIANPKDKSIQDAWDAAYADPKFKMARIVLNQNNPKLGDRFAIGNSVYHSISKRPKEASALLREKGIPGIKYLDAGSRGAGDGTRNYVVFDDKLISIIRKYGIAGASAMLGYNLMENLDPKQALAATMADNDYKSSVLVDEGDDVNNALRLAKDIGGATTENPQVFLTDAKGRQYDAQGNPIQPAVTQEKSNSAATTQGPTPEEVGRRAAEDPATFDAMMQKYAIPDRDVAEYEALQTAVRQQPQEIQQMTHVGAPPMRDVKVDMPLFGGEYSVGQAPYNVANPMSGIAQTAYDLKTVPLYFTPWTAPIGAGLDVAEGVATGDPLTASLAIGFGPGGKMAKAAGIGAANYLIDPSEAEAGPARWFSKAMEVAREIPMNKMTGEQALAMLRKGASPEELRWTGADVFLQNRPQVTKDELIDYLQNNRMQPNEVVLGGGNPWRREDVVLDDEIKSQFRERMNKAQADRLKSHNDFVDAKKKFDAGLMDYDSFRKISNTAGNAQTALFRLENEIVDAQIAKMGGLGVPTRFGPLNYGGKYATRGGEGYTENLFTLPDNWARYNSFVDSLRAKYGPGGLDNLPLSSGERATLDRLMESIGDERGRFREGHWDRDDVLAHTRTQFLEVTPPGANRPYKGYNIDEAQSKWGQEGRSEGFKSAKGDQQIAQLRDELNNTLLNANDIETNLKIKHYTDIQPIKDQREAAMEELKQKYRRGEITMIQYNEQSNKVYDDFSKLIDPYSEIYRKNIQEKVTPLRNRVNDLGRQIEAISSKIGMIPEAPFVGSTEGWTDLTIKKSLDKALDSDAEYFTWTPGETHVQRYNLENHVDEIQYYKNDDGRYVLGVTDKSGEGVDLPKESFSPEELKKLLGNEMADKIVSGEGKRYAGREGMTLDGLDLKIGGEGMRGYYENIFKKRIEDVFKKALGYKPNIEVIEAQTADGPRKQFGIRLTDEMREKARFSDFNKGGRVTGGNAYDNDKSVENALALTREY